MAMLAEDLDDRLVRAFDHVQALILGGRPQETDELRIDFYGNEARIRAHAPQDFRRNAADTRAIFHDHARLRPVDRLQQLLDQESRAWNDRAQKNCARTAKRVRFAPFSRFAAWWPRHVRYGCYSFATPLLIRALIPGHT